ncbi:MAG: signal peptidase II [Mycobacteriaceae bacterium]
MSEVTTSKEKPAKVSQETAGKRSSSVGRRPQLVGLALIIVCMDILTKCLAVARLENSNSTIDVIGNVVRFTVVRNPGAAFSMATGMTWVLTVVAIAVVVGIVMWGRRLVSLWWVTGLALVLGGALGNLIDRFFRTPGPLQGHVVDFISVGWWPVFNIADSSIVCGALLMVGLSLKGVEFDGSQRQSIIESSIDSEKN